MKVIRIKAVPKKMKYDRTNFSVPPGRSVEIRFHNPDQIPHNLVITVPGALEAVGKASVSSDNRRKNEYVPQGKEMEKKILWHTDLVESGGTAVLRFQAPDDPGEYPFVCTFPGHWRTMNGTMRVEPSE